MQGQVLLVALIVPGSVEAELGRVQAALFSERGLASAMALPPLIPIAFPSAGVPDDVLAALDRSVAAPWRIHVRGPAWVRGSLYLSVDTGGVWDVLRGKVHALCGPERPAPFAPAEGFFMGCCDASAADREAIHPALPSLSFSSAEVATLRLDSADWAGGWWRELYWEIVEQRPLRGRREK